MWHAWEREETCTGFWWESPKGKRPLKRPRRRWEDGIRKDLWEIGWGVWSGFTWLRTGIVGGLLWMRWWTFGFWLHGVSKYCNLTWQLQGVDFSTFSMKELQKVFCILAACKNNFCCSLPRNAVGDCTVAVWLTAFLCKFTFIGGWFESSPRPSLYWLVIRYN
jgi:hypothetical protein